MSHKGNAYPYGSPGVKFFRLIGPGFGRGYWYPPDRWYVNEIAPGTVGWSYPTGTGYPSDPGVPTSDGLGVSWYFPTVFSSYGFVAWRLNWHFTIGGTVDQVNPRARMYIADFPHCDMVNTFEPITANNDECNLGGQAYAAFTGFDLGFIDINCSPMPWP